jgi:hypothetical protein
VLVSMKEGRAKHKAAQKRDPWRPQMERFIAELGADPRDASATPASCHFRCRN